MTRSFEAGGTCHKGRRGARIPDEAPSDTANARNSGPADRFLNRFHEANGRHWRSSTGRLGSPAAIRILAAQRSGLGMNPHPGLPEPGRASYQGP
jgi:hypothetical protein